VTFRFDLDAALADLRKSREIRPTVPTLPTLSPQPVWGTPKDSVPPTYADPRFERAVRDTWIAFEAMDDIHNPDAWQ
jgi:hypothetical protein